MRVQKMLLVALIASTVLSFPFAAHADLTEWKKMEFETSGPPQQPAQSLEELRAMFADPLVCSGCHPSHYEAWSKSYHARSVRNAGFQALYRKYLEFLETDQAKKALGRPASTEELRQCLFCHAPQVQFASDKVVEQISAAVAAGNWDGVRGAQISCVACHALNPEKKWETGSLAGTGTLFGPLRDPAPGAMHKSAYSAVHTKSELCGICHSVRTFNVYCSLVYDQHKAADPEGKVQCQDCHMKGRENLPVAITGEKNRILHDHTFPGGRFEKMWNEAIGLDLRGEQQTKGKVAVAVTIDSKITHNIPDG